MAMVILCLLFWSQRLSSSTEKEVWSDSQHWWKH